MTPNTSKKSAGILVQGSVIAMLIASMLLFPSSKDTISFLHKTSFNTLCHLSSIQKVKEDLQTPFAGEYVLPSEVQVMIALLRAFRVETFKYSAAIQDNLLFRQRLTEGAYPLRVSETSHILVYFQGEPIPGTCKTLAVREGVAIAYCP
jgi:hypothetical protein